MIVTRSVDSPALCSQPSSFPPNGEQRSKALFDVHEYVRVCAFYTFVGSLSTGDHYGTERAPQVRADFWPCSIFGPVDGHRYGDCRVSRD